MNKSSQTMEEKDMEKKERKISRGDRVQLVIRK